MKRIMHVLLATGLAAPTALAQPATQPPPLPAMQPAPPVPPPGTTTSPKTEDGDQGFVSKKTGKKLNKAEIEDITNENFPDMIESFDYPNADIADVVKAISELTGKNFIIDPAVHGKITIIAPSRITVAEAYKAFLSALAINSLAVVPGDGFYKIKQARSAQRDNIDTFSGAYYPTSDQMITRIIKLKYISADEVNKQLRILTSKDGELVPYTPTNSLIVSDYGANIDRIMKILQQLDVQGFEEQMEVIRIRYARSKDIKDLVEQIINKGEKNTGFGGVPRFRPAGMPEAGSTNGAEVYSVVVSDDRTNSIVVVGNKAGIDKIRHLIARLDFPMRSDEQGGFHVYYLRHAEAEPIANMINGIAQESKKAQDAANQAKQAQPQFGPGGQIQAGPSPAAIFGGEVKVTADKNTNSLIVVGSQQDFLTVKNLIEKIDIAKDQVFIKAYILEMSSNIQDNWGVDFYKFAGDPNGIGRIGFAGGPLSNVLNPTTDSGGILGFGLGNQITITPGGGAAATTPGAVPTGIPITIPSVIAFINLLKTETATNILSTPQITALNNEEATIEVGRKVPVSETAVQGTNGTVTPQVNREDVTTKLVITPFISPDTDSVKLKLDQDIADLDNSVNLGALGATALAASSVVTTKRKIKTNVVLNSGDTLVLGGLMQDRDTDQVTKVPLLGDIPIIGWLFKSTSKTKLKSNIVILITPRILRSVADADKVLDDKLNERIDFIQRNMNGRDPHGRYMDEIRRNKAANAQPTKPDKETPAVETF